MKENSPKVSIIMATYNRAHFILESLESIQNQIFKNWECLIIDDGSDDDTENVVRAFVKEDSRFIFLKRPAAYKKGLPGCRNFGLDSARGKYNVFYDDDDIVHSENLEISTTVLKENKNVSFVVYQKQAFESEFSNEHFTINTAYNVAHTKQTYLEDVVCQKAQIASCTVLWKKECFSDLRFNVSLAYAEEWECYTRILSKGVKGIILDKVLYFNRKHANSNTGEFWRNSQIRIDSKKQAIFLIASHLAQQKQLTADSFNYLVGLSINYRDWDLMNRILILPSKLNYKKWLYKVKFVLFPIWRLFKQTTK